jgi:hypothetical protein
MKITHFSHTGVAPDGTLAAGGAVEVIGGVRYSAPEGGCGMPGCHCSPGHWLSITCPRTEDGVVSGYTAHFDSRRELENVDRAEIEQQAQQQLSTQTKE